MHTFYRDMTILALAVVVGVIWSLYSLVTRRGRRMRERRQREADAERAQRRGERQEPIPELAEYAAAHGWTGPSADLGSDEMTGEYVETMLRNLSGNPRSAEISADVGVEGPEWSNLYSGTSNGRAFVVGNVWMGFRDAATRSHIDGSLCVLHLNEALPPLLVNLRGCRPFLRLGMKEMTFESEDFNRRFQVVALNREYTMDLITERVMALLMERDDWVFFLELDRMICLARSPLRSPEDYAARVDALGRFAALIPAFVEQDRAMQMPTLPDGTVIDPTDEASMAKVERAVSAMSPEERRRFVSQAQVAGARFIAGMFGKDLPPDAEERLRKLQDES